MAPSTGIICPWNPGTTSCAVASRAKQVPNREMSLYETHSTKSPSGKKAAPLSNFCKQLRHLTSSQSLIPRYSLKSSSPWLDCARDSVHRLKRPVVKYSRTPCGSLGLSRPINLSKNCSQCPRSKDCPQTRVSSSSSNLRPLTTVGPISNSE